MTTKTHAIKLLEILADRAQSQSLTNEIRDVKAAVDAGDIPLEPENRKWAEL